MREINPNLDKESAAQMQFIVVREAIENLEKIITEMAKEDIAPLFDRVKTLEEARQVQRQLNVKFESFLKDFVIVRNVTAPVAETKSSKPKGWWDWLK